MKTIGHHTLENRGNAAVIKGPKESKYKGKNHKNNPFLGEGYYFWDNNIEMAHEWGKTRYKYRGYYIFQGNLDLHEDDFCDLVGNRTHQMLVKELFNTMKVKHGKSDWDLAQFFNFLRILIKGNPKQNKDIFPYKYIRAADLSAKTKYIVNISKDKWHQTNLNPVYIVCMYEVNDVSLQNFTLINTFSSK